MTVIPKPLLPRCINLQMPHKRYLAAAGKAGDFTPLAASLSEAEAKILTNLRAFYPDCIT